MICFSFDQLSQAYIKMSVTPKCDMKLSIRICRAYRGLTRKFFWVNLSVIIILREIVFPPKNSKGKLFIYFFQFWTKSK